MSPTTVAPRRVLIVEDSIDLAESLEMALTMDGHEVQIAHDGATALHLAPRFQPDVILLDIGLPVMDGYQVASRLRTELGMTDVVIAAVSGYGQEKDILRSQQAGINHHLVKPVSPEMLDQILAGAPRRGPG